jgi:hypothetical protein
VTDTGHDPILLRIGTDWLVQYARFLRRSPEVVNRLIEQTEEFELVPVPKALLGELAVPGIVGSGGLGGDVDVTLERLLRTRDTLAPAAITGAAVLATEIRDDAATGVLDALRRFARSLEEGHLDEVASLIDSRYLDADARTGRELLAELRRLIEDTEDRRLLVIGLTDMVQHGDDASVRVDVVWDARRTVDHEVVRITEPLTIAAQLRREPDDRWAISGLRLA